jgi:hypothetical protein
MERVGLLLKGLWAPGETMVRLAKSPRVVAPLVALSLLSLATAAVMAVQVDQGELTVRLIERTSGAAQLPDELRQRIKEQANSPLQLVARNVSSIVFPIIWVALVAAIYFGLFTIFGREGSYKAFLSITAFAFLPTVFRHLASILTLFVVPESSIMIEELGSMSPAVFLDRSEVSAVLFTAVSTVDLVTIWILSLLVIGFGFVIHKRVSLWIRALVVAGVYMVYVVGRLGVAYWTGI